MATYRKQNPVLQTGKLMQFIPENGVYVYFRYNDAKTMMVVYNSNAKATSLSTQRFAERLQGFSQARNVLNSEVLANISELSVPAHGALVLALE